MESQTLRELIDLHRAEILERWSELWSFIQRKRPESSFPDPPYDAILDQLPYDPLSSAQIAEPIMEWFTDSPIFCEGAAFCQLHVTVASLLIREKYENRASLLKTLEDSLESLILNAGTRRWITNLLMDSGKKEAVQSDRLSVIGQLAAGVAHEIGNPLASISSIVQILRRKTEDAFFIEQLTHVKKSIDRIAKIVHEMTDFARPAPAVLSATQPHEILQMAINLAKYDRRAKDVEIVFERADILPLVHIVPDQLMQVFLNLLINAVDAMDGAGVILIREWTEEDSVKISISDTGHGIPEAMLHRIFDPFFSTKPAGKGTGLGLSVSYGILSRYGGKIEVESRDGHGSTFIVVLPGSSRQDSNEINRHSGA